MPQRSTVVSVDEQLGWVVRAPESPAGAARASSPQQRARLEADLDAAKRAARDAARRENLLGVVAVAVLQCLREPPELPFIGEPFGGEEGTD